MRYRAQARSAVPILHYLSFSFTDARRLARLSAEHHQASEKYRERHFADRRPACYPATLNRLRIIPPRIHSL